MKEIVIGKVVVNMGVGGDPDAMKKAKQIIELLTKKKSVQTQTRAKIPDWGLRPGLAIGLKVTLRGKDAIDFLNKALAAKGKKLLASNFDGRGNFGFGIREYIDMPDVRYDPKLGIRGFDVLISLKRRGYRVKDRKIRPSKLGKKHVVTKQEAIDFVSAMGVEVA